MRLAAILVLSAVCLAGCGTVPTGDFTEFRHTDLYFGRDIPDPPDATVDRRVSDADWDDFLNMQVVPHFAGVTVQPAEGRWFDGQKVISEDSIVLTVMYPEAEAARYQDIINAIARAYVQRFEQQAVLIEQRSTLVRFEEGK